MKEPMKPLPAPREADLDGPALSDEERDEAGNERGADPGRSAYRPQRKWFASALGAIALNLLAAVGVDVGAIAVDLVELVGIDADEAEFDAEARTLIGALAAHYLWPEYKGLPDPIQRLVDRLILRRDTEPA